MKNIKNFEAYMTDKEKAEKEKEQIELLKDLLIENPSYNTHDFYIFIGRPEFKEEDDGKYRKTIEIENMVKITPDANSLAAMSGLQMRAMVQHDSTLYHIWLPKDIEDEVSGKGSNTIEPWLVDLINTHKQKGADSHGRQVFKDVKQRRDDINKFNI